MISRDLYFTTIFIPRTDEDESPFVSPVCSTDIDLSKRGIVLGERENGSAMDSENATSSGSGSNSNGFGAATAAGDDDVDSERREIHTNSNTNRDTNSKSNSNSNITPPRLRSRSKSADFANDEPVDTPVVRRYHKEEAEKSGNSGDFSWGLLLRTESSSDETTAKR
jgi:hypothetical protein